MLTVPSALHNLGLSFIFIPCLISQDKRRLSKRTGAETQTCVTHTYHPRKGIDFNSKMSLSDYEGRAM
jgi:hypothetical protein